MRIGIQSITMVKTIYWIQHTKKDGTRKNNNKDGKALYKLMKNAIYEKKMENLGNRIDLTLVNSKKDDLKCTSKPTYMSHKIFDNNLVTIRKSKLALTIYLLKYEQTLRKTKFYAVLKLNDTNNHIVKDFFLFFFRHVHIWFVSKIERLVS